MKTNNRKTDWNSHESHGHARINARSGEYKTWLGMIQRCTNEKHTSYKDYGGRGITICDRWLNSFTEFLNDMGPRPDGHSIERIDNNGNYEPQNCKWASQKEQATNRRDIVHLTINNETLTIEQWAERSGISADIIYTRIKNNWSPERAISEPAKKILSKEEILEICNSNETQMQLAERFNTSQSAVQAILCGRNCSHITGIIRKKDENRKQNIYLEFTPELLDKTKKWLEEGLSKRKIAKQLNVSRTVVDRLCSKLENK
jgi:phosphopantetheinyl transferase (holo-ACP synthase)